MFISVVEDENVLDIEILLLKTNYQPPIVSVSSFSLFCKYCLTGILFYFGLVLVWFVHLLGFVLLKIVLPCSPHGLKLMIPCLILIPEFFKE